ncbi:MAG: pilus assembly protein TadG-related protein [Vicinamibacterales bacterium]
MLVQVSIALVGLVALSAFVVDYGVMWVARRQAQNAADAGAMAGAISMGFVDLEDIRSARHNAVAASQANLVWGAPPDITLSDVTFPACPPGSPAAGTSTCVRVDVFRNQRAGGNPLPTFFGNMVGVSEQGVRASSTAGVIFSDVTDCVKPFAVADKWQELNNDQGTAGWSDEDHFNRYVQSGPGAGQLLSPADYYEAPGPSGLFAPYGTGFTRSAAGLGGSDHGRRLVISPLTLGNEVEAGGYLPIVVNPDEGGGETNYRGNISGCDPTVVGPGAVHAIEANDMATATASEVSRLIQLDPDARWHSGLFGMNLGGIRGGCMASGSCTVSPRLVAVPMFNPDVYDAARAAGATTVTITKVVGVFLDSVQGTDVIGYLTPYPTAPRGVTATPSDPSFVVGVSLVR